jgi:alkylhydroperoxidase/carboxymuconolactone decarboxylase family protein YurZ
MTTTSSGNRRVTDKTAAVEERQVLGPWGEGLDQLRQWDPAWVETCVQMTTSPWTAGVLSRKFIELVGVGLNAACTNLNPDGTRRHIRAALAAGATRSEILLVLKCASVMSIHSCSLGAPILLEEAQAAGVEPTTRTSTATPTCDRVKEIGQWNVAWDPFYALDPVWTDEFMATGIDIYTSDALTAKEVELLSVALDAS